MSTKPMQQVSIMLPHDLAEIIDGKIRSGAYVSASEVVCDGLRALLERDAAVEQWLREDAAAGYAECMADRSKGIEAEAIPGRMKALRAISKAR
jgi:antitoxin ParD1/3/4